MSGRRRFAVEGVLSPDRIVHCGAEIPSGAHVVAHVMGATCAGKSTFIDAVCRLRPDAVRVEIGRMLRAKYGDAHFAGQAAPEHTALEAWDLYVTGVRKAIERGAGLVLVDGQPRDVMQARGAVDLSREMRARMPPVEFRWLLLHADEAERSRRAEAARTGDSLELAKARLRNDYRNCYVAMTELMLAGERIDLLPTDRTTPAEWAGIMVGKADACPT